MGGLGAGFNRLNEGVGLYYWAWHPQACFSRKLQVISVLSILALCLQLLLGFILGVAFTKTRNIWPVIAAHFLFDFFSMVLNWLFLVPL
jgi:membrane protease YdiL (CAAX protease family)